MSCLVIDITQRNYPILKVDDYGNPLLFEEYYQAMDFINEDTDNNIIVEYEDN